MHSHAMIFSRKHKAHRQAAWLAIFALLLQTIIPALHHPATMAMGGMASMDVAGNMCMAPGSTEQAPGDHDKAPQHHQIPACALCQAVHAIGGFAPPSAPVVALAAIAESQPYLIRTAFLLRQQTGVLAQPRGPPATI